MMWCPLILASDIDLRDVGVRQDAYDLGLCSFILIGGHFSLKDKYVTRACVLVSL
jgi:hypothetical protein